MSKFTEDLRALKIFNPSGFAGHGNVYITYTPRGDGRSLQCAEWSVCRPGYKTEPNGPWYDYGNKTFLLFDGGKTHKDRKEATLAVAKKWAAERYHIKEWARTPYGDWMDAQFVRTRIAELKAMLKAKEGQ